MANEEQTRTWPLSTVVTLWSAAAMALAMGLYAALEVLAFGEPVSASFLKHMSHVVALSAFILAAMTVVVYKKVTMPIGAINGYLYRLGAGDTLFPPPTSNIAELRQLTRGILAMMDRMHSGAPGLARTQADQALADLKDIAKDLAEVQPLASSKILDSTVRLGECVASIQRITRK